MFSIIIPLYNKEQYVSKTLESVFAQTFQQYEIIIVDDGSTDKSVEVVKGFTDPRMRLISQKNQGVSAARNRGISEALFNYIAFLDADDWWEPAYLEEMKHLADKYPECTMYGAAYKVVRNRKTFFECAEVPEGVVDDYFKMRVKYPVTWTSATVVKREAFNIVGGFPVGMIAGEDGYMWCKIADKYKVALTPKVLATYNMIHTGASLRAGKLDSCSESWYDFYKEGDFYRNEFIAGKAIHAAIRYAIGLHKIKSREVEKLYSYTVLSKRRWRLLYFLNRTPAIGIALFEKIHFFYLKLKN
ncbi:MAG: glycosyltransferase family 2 protein [Chitinophagaceae bacterium]|nr:glycosyltransferase family 2 protein [Chitinophagaceae bacterium]